MSHDKFYCNQKFWWLTVHLEKLQIASCCSAAAMRVDQDWVKANPGELFNYPELLKERKLMLANQPVSSCESNCWISESKNLPSRRTIMLGNQPTHQSLYNDPELLNIIVERDCNLTCVYCCKYYSTAWLRDVESKPYAVNTTDDRFSINTTDRILSKLGQKDHAKSDFRQTLIQEIQNLYTKPSLKEIQITGGEPFLNLNLVPMLQGVPEHVAIKVWSGLGVSENRFEKIVQQLPRNTTVVISAENTQAQYEFTRHGNTWQRFVNNLKILQKYSVPYEFMSVITNITVFGIDTFVHFADGVKIHYNQCSDPDFLSVSVLDPRSKQIVAQQRELPSWVQQALEVDPTQDQVYNFKTYITDFSARRNLSFDIFPESFQSWVLQ